ncbi:hypothetical protein [Paracoccus marinaquae]|uniref:Type IV / VI secretion system DotU domain-containing protein n=1 Tax=Paracoccus marinaquae TaxID=2841926 RepID=A0ABS6ADK0_9RHOB|nr:hypothetical protein [Paracoccus marinaquae]MBU3028651.1 hypothetical protein [Paracoccus marinaquae]
MSHLAKADFEARYRGFDELDPVAQGGARKQLIRALEADLRQGVAPDLLDSRDLAIRLASGGEIDRILSSLLIEQGRVAVAPGDDRRHVESEWDRLSRAGFGPATSRQPLHYALRAYAAGLSRDGQARGRSADLAFLDTMLDRMRRSPTDAGSRVEEKTAEIRRLIADDSAETASHPVEVRTARIALIAAVAVAVIGLIGTLGGELIKVFLGASR